MIAEFALIVSLASFGVSAYVALRDRKRLRAKSTFYAAHEGRDSLMHVEAVNVGRRPVILTMLGGYYDDGSWSGTYLTEDKSGVRLAENEKFSADIDDVDDVVFEAKSGAKATDL